jgi:hypothetical protein
VTGQKSQVLPTPLRIKVLAWLYILGISLFSISTIGTSSTLAGLGFTNTERLLISIPVPIPKSRMARLVDDSRQFEEFVRTALRYGEAPEEEKQTKVKLLEYPSRSLPTRASSSTVSDNSITLVDDQPESGPMPFTQVRVEDLFEGSEPQLRLMSVFGAHHSNFHGLF